jgi:hypothetical protein
MQVFDDRFQAQSGWNCSSILTVLLLLLHQGPLHHSLQAYCAALNPSDLGRSHLRRQVPPRPHNVRDPSSERWNLRARIVR